MCDQCRMLQARIARLEARVKKLERIIKLAQRIIKRQKKQLDAARQVTWSIATEAKRKMDAGNLPRGEYAFHKGRFEVAETIYHQCLIVDWASQFLEMLG